jgi:hypothetical protein
MIEEESEELFFAFALNCSLLVLWKKNGMIEEESEDLGQAWQEYSRQKQRTIPGISAIPGIAVCNMEAKMSKTKDGGTAGRGCNARPHYWPAGSRA